jgi:serine/threonine protein kinase
VGNYAVKCPRVPAATGSDIERAIIHEIFLSRPLSHIPNILIVYGGIRLPNYGVSIVMEYINGPSLATALDDGTILNLTLQERLDIALGICKGLGELHLSQIIHRDFKPANVLLERASTGYGYIPKIADFGVSFLIQTASATAVKNSGGTVGYDAPEVAKGGTPSIQSDIYALAFTLYELLTVHRPFVGYKESQIITKFTLQGERPTDWSVSTADRTSIILPEFLKNTIEKGWSMVPENRARIGDIICAVRKSINSNYQSCPEQMFWEYGDSSYDFMDKFDSFELLAIQEIIKRSVIDDSEAIGLLLNNDTWG